MVNYGDRHEVYPETFFSVILVTGDGDFIPLVTKLLDRKVQVTLIGALRNTNSDWQKLKQRQGFKFISLDSISDEITKL